MSLLNDRAREQEMPRHERARTFAGGIDFSPKFPDPLEGISGEVDDDLLALQYPAFAPKIKAARDVGYPEEEIKSFLINKRADAIAEGYPIPEIDAALGITDESRKTYIRKVLAGRDNLDALLEGVTPEELTGFYEQAKKAGVPRAGAALFTQRQRLSQNGEVSLLADYADILEERQKSGKVQEPGKYHSAELERDRGPVNDFARSVNDTVGEMADSSYKRTLGGMTVGFLSSAEGIIRGGAYLSHVFGWQDGYSAASSFADRVADGTDGLSQMNYEGVNQNLWDAAMQGIGSQAMYLLPGVFAKALSMYGDGARAVSVGKRIVGTLANITGAAVSATTESLSEAGSVFDEIYQRTGDEEAASTGAAWTFWLNMPTNFISDKIAFFGEDTFLRGLIPKIAKSSGLMQNLLYQGAKRTASAVAEGTQETMQGTVSEHYGSGTDWTAIDMSKVAFEQGIPGAIVGALLGGAHGVSFKQAAAIVDRDKRIKEFRQRASDTAGVMRGVTDALAGTDYDEKTKKAYAGVWAARALAASRQQGITPMEWYEKQGLSVEQIAGDDVQAEADALNQNSYQKKKMSQTMRDWAANVDRVLDAPDKTKVDDFVRVMDSPLVLSLVGGNILNVAGNQGISINEQKMLKIQNDHHLKRHVVKQIPKALADPVAIFESTSNEGNPQNNDVVFILNLEDENNKPVVAAVWLESNSSGLVFNKLASYYGKDNVSWIDKQIQDGRLMYINRKKSSLLAGRHGLPVLSVTANNKLDSSIKTEEDLVKLKTENPTYNQAARAGNSAAEEEIRRQEESVRAKYEGTDGWLKAPNGANTKLTEKQWVQVRTPFFKAWFGDWENDPDNASRVIDENGEPLVVYHSGTFGEKGNSIADKPVHFGTRKAAEERIYIKEMDDLIIAGLEVYQNDDGEWSWAFENVSSEDDGTTYETEQEARKAGGEFAAEQVSGIEPTDYAEGEGPTVLASYLNLRHVIHTLDKGNDWESAISRVKENNMDGIAYINQFEDVGSTSYIAFDSNQIKSATDNIGTFDSRNPDIYHQHLRGNVRFDSGKALVKLFQAKDRSSFLHESGHIFLEDFAGFIASGKAGERDLKDWQAFLDWTGLKSWENASVEDSVRAHEMFARGMEKYFWEGIAPSSSLERLFKRFSIWLREIYKGASEFDVEISPEVKAMYDHLFGMAEESDAALGGIISRGLEDDADSFNQSAAPDSASTADTQGSIGASSLDEDSWEYGDFEPEDAAAAAVNSDMDAALMGDEDALARLSMAYRSAPGSFTDEQKENLRKAKEAFISGINANDSEEQVTHEAPVTAEALEADYARRDAAAAEAASKPDNARQYSPEMKEYDQFAASILANGGLLYTELKTAIGEDKARAILQTARNLIKKNAPAIKDIAEKLGLSVDEMADKILNKPEIDRYKVFFDNPLVYVNNDSYIWLIQRMGHERAEAYLKSRVGLLQAVIASNDDAMRKNKGGKNQWFETFSYLKEQAKRELYFIQNKALLDVQDEMRSGRGLNEPTYDLLDWREFTKYAAKQEAALASMEIHGTAGPAIKNPKIRDLVVERAHAKRQARLMSVFSRELYRAGSKSAAMFVRQKNMAYEQKRRERSEVRGDVQSLIWKIKHAASGELRCTAKQEIADVINKYNLERGGYFQMPGDKPSDYNNQLKAVRDSELADLNEYLDMNDEGKRASMVDMVEQSETITNLDNLDPMTEDFAELNRTMLCEMTIEDLRSLAKQVDEIRERGKLEYAAWKEQQEKELREIQEPLVETMGGKTGGDSSAPVIPGKTVRGKENGRLTNALIYTLNPSRIFDTLDDFADFRGAWHNLFKRRADECESSFLRNKHRRIDNMKVIMENFGIKDMELAQEKLNHKDVDGTETSLTLDECLSIYVGWHNKYTRDALMYGNHITEEMARSVFAALSDEEKNFASAVCGETSAESARYVEVMKDVYNVAVENEPWYMRMYRTNWTDSNGQNIDEGIKGVMHDIARQYGLRKLYAERGSSYARKMIPIAYQQPIAIGLMKVWQRSAIEHEHLIAYGKLVRQLHSVVGEKTDYTMVNPIVGMKDAIVNTYGKEVEDFLLNYVNTLANPDFYRQFKLGEASFRALRANMGVAYLWGNIATVIKQPTSFAYYLQDAGVNCMMSSIAEFVSAPEATMHKVWALDPEVKEQQMNMFLEALKSAEAPTELRLKMKKFGEAGFAPMMWTDMITRVIGWNAVYKKEIADGKSMEEAAYRAKLVTLNTQNAVHPKELPLYMKSGSEMVNLLTQFTNQANKIFGVTAHDLYGDIKKGRLHHGFNTLMGLLIAALFMSWLEKGKVPSTGGEFVNDIVVSKTLGNIPLVGAGFISAATKFQGGATPMDTIAGDIYRAVDKAFDGEFVDPILAIYEAYALSIGGVPVTAVKRAVRFAETGKLSDLTGLMRTPGNRKQKFIP